MIMLKRYLAANLLAGFRVSPWRAPLRAWVLVPLFAVIALLVGFRFDLFDVGLVVDPWVPVLPFAVLIVPAVTEEAIFRGLLMPRQLLHRGPISVTLAIGWSTVFYVVWHPLNAFLFKPSARELFYDPAFLFIVAALGITCGYSYAVSRSLWVPILIHWATVAIWVLLLGGRYMLLEM